MEKKHYQKPAITAIDIETAPFMAGSINSDATHIDTYGPQESGNAYDEAFSRKPKDIWTRGDE